MCFFEVGQQQSQQRTRQPQHYDFLNAAPISQAHGTASGIDYPALPWNRKSLYKRNEGILLTSPSSTTPSYDTSTAKTLPSHSHTFQELPNLHISQKRREYEAYETEEDRRRCECTEE
jgi:hypothetical protein